MPYGPKPKSLRERFFAMFDKRGANECWLWNGSLSSGYGYMRLPGPARKRIGAHVVAFWLKHGRWPKSCALHKCDVRRCVNPAHIFEGTKRDNTLDMVAKGRHGGSRRKDQSPEYQR